MKELLYDGFIMRMKSELENPMKKDDLTNLLLEVEKFMKYFPDRKENKWISNVDNTIVQLVDVMPKQGDILFITSSKKDAGIIIYEITENEADL